MFHIYSSAIKYMCAKYTIFFLHRGEKTRRTPLIRGDQRPPPLEEGEIHPRQTEQEEGRRGGTPQQVIVMLWIEILSPQKVHRS
ncbi:hypothetical protein AB205_0147040 [Aquarana catesbeiana]|uniref:Uncharacterized protein n=1 Tax=Aquarana catesbeiana TaxID=8400 RepID=A0A2G9Q8K9_AQUCT|nr:hypothetical protein AB205_0147040 [Aquarana catesbeiana]